MVGFGSVMALASASGGSGGAAEPAAIGYLTLAAMNKGSAKIGAFLVRVAHPVVSTYSYKRKSDSRNPVVAHKFSCLLLGAGEDAESRSTSSYCVGLGRGTEAQVKALGVKYKAGEVLKLTKSPSMGVSERNTSTRHSKWLWIWRRPRSASCRHRSCS